jgi:SAM-dependent methyltransferase
MSVEVLLTKSQNREARAELRRRGLSFAPSYPERVLRKVGILGGVNLGDIYKSWDVLKTTQFIETNVPKDGRILDLGACGSEALCILSRLGYPGLVGIDLNRRIGSMPKPVKYTVGNFMQLPFRDASFEAVTAISVIEHGFHAEALLKELTRVVKPGGYFVASVDYWPNKIETEGVEEYGMSWLIFSRAEINEFLEKASAFGFWAMGNVNLEAEEKTTRWMGREYTFAWFVLQKGAPSKTRNLA